MDEGQTVHTGTSNYIPNSTRGSERSNFALLTVEYQLWNLSQKEDARRQLINNDIYFDYQRYTKGRTGRQPFYFVQYTVLGQIAVYNLLEYS